MSEDYARLENRASFRTAEILEGTGKVLGVVVGVALLAGWVFLGMRYGVPVLPAPSS